MGGIEMWPIFATREGRREFTRVVSAVSEREVVIPVGKEPWEKEDTKDPRRTKLVIRFIGMMYTCQVPREGGWTMEVPILKKRKRKTLRN